MFYSLFLPLMSRKPSSLSKTRQDSTSHFNKESNGKDNASFVRYSDQMHSSEEIKASISRICESKANQGCCFLALPQRSARQNLEI